MFRFYFYLSSNNVLGISAGLHEVGHLKWQLVLSLLAAWTLVGICLIKGIKSQGKVSTLWVFVQGDGG